MLTAVFGLSSALIFGAADFFGGLASKRISPIRVTAVSAVAGFVVLLVGLLIIPGEWSWSAVLLGGLSGVAGALAIVLLYGCLAIGPMSILSPLTALVSAFVPLTVGLLRGEQLPFFGYVGIGLALVAVVLVGFVREENAARPNLKGLLMALGSGLMIGVFLVVIDLTPDDSGLVPLVANRAVNASIMFAVVGVLAVVAVRSRNSVSEPTGMLKRGWRGGVWIAAGAGLIDAVANALMLLGLRTGDLSVMSVLVALYPAGTIILAAIVLRERVTAGQVAGLVLALAAAALLALA
ncbi:DMT family transporter [Cryobacterium sp. BB736]|uniref:DMT family transporter n=1 Tax=Cryobacterium sp. BB736 TaxID=2746963 RepID=UPI001877025F|nr:DMT family transporter [Cryobacterium sp. BB736]